jgi:hypothetical protein
MQKHLTNSLSGYNKMALIALPRKHGLTFNSRTKIRIEDNQPKVESFYKRTEERLKSHKQFSPEDMETAIATFQSQK